MKATVARFLTVTVSGAVVAALVGSRGPFGAFWGPASDMPHPQGALLAGFVAEGLVEDLAFGLGLAVLLLGRPWFALRVAGRRATTAWLAACWLLASWWPHSALHQHVGMDPAALLPIEWIFHAGSIVAAGLLLCSFSRTARHNGRQDSVISPVEEGRYGVAGG